MISMRFCDLVEYQAWSSDHAAASSSLPALKVEMVAVERDQTDQYPGKRKREIL